METKKIICCNCHKQLRVGDEVIHTENGVIGTRENFVNLNDEKLFCCEECLKEFYDLGDLPSLPPRIP